MRILIFSLLAALCLPFIASAQQDDATQKLVNGALADFEAKKYDDALIKLLDAQKADPNSAFLLNLLGAAYTKKKEYATAKSYFEQSLDKDPGFFPSHFNIGELLFLQKNYPDALDYFAKMLNRDPGNELLQFKVVLCLLLTDQTDEAEKLIKRMKVPGEGPAWYYSNAAVNIFKGDKRKSIENINLASTFFPSKVSLYNETFDDLGWATK